MVRVPLLVIVPLLVRVAPLAMVRVFPFSMVSVAPLGISAFSDRTGFP